MRVFYIIVTDKHGDESRGIAKASQVLPKSLKSHMYVDWRLVRSIKVKRVL